MLFSPLDRGPFYGVTDDFNVTMDFRLKMDPPFDHVILGVNPD